MRNPAFEPDPDWIVPDRVFAPGYEPQPSPPAAIDPADGNILGADLWRGVASLALVFVAVAAIASVVI